MKNRILCYIHSGCTASGITTPLDVAKTRIMLAEVCQLHQEKKLLNLPYDSI
jgi:hypothetical protein